MKKSQLLAAMLMAGGVAGLPGVSFGGRSTPLHVPKPEHLKAALDEAKAKRDRKAARKGRA